MTLKTLRTKRKLSQTEAAKLLGVVLRTYAAWERGDYPIPALKRDAVIRILSGK